MDVFRQHGARNQFAIAALLYAVTCAGAGPSVASDPAGSWRFVVSGDSRNCGDVVMPSIAAAASAVDASFYWHLGDLRAIYDFDEDYRQQHPTETIIGYETKAWDDFIRNQVEPFGDIPVFLGIGNHETTAPKTRADFTLAFADWLDAPALRQQRLQDDPHDHSVRTYYHWVQRGVDFINLDNATPDQFDQGQLAWFRRVLMHATANSELRAIVVGMHEALPDSLASGHSMSDAPVALATGRVAYQLLLDARATKPVYVLASHSHFVMEGIFDTPYWREHGGVLPGWIVGTAGAVRYALPPGAGSARFARTGVYGYLRATVSPPGVKDADPIRFEFQEVTEQDVPLAVKERFTPAFVHRCYAGNGPS
jgi:calcineurin-like phosphoesterase family protein